MARAPIFREYYIERLFMIMVLYLVVFRELVIVHRSLSINEDGIFERDSYRTYLCLVQSIGKLLMQK